MCSHPERTARPESTPTPARVQATIYRENPRIMKPANTSDNATSLQPRRGRVNPFWLLASMLRMIAALPQPDG